MCVYIYIYICVYYIYIYISRKLAPLAEPTLEFSPLPTSKRWFFSQRGQRPAVGPLPFSTKIDKKTILVGFRKSAPKKMLPGASRGSKWAPEVDPKS